LIEFDEGEQKSASSIISIGLHVAKIEIWHGKSEKQPKKAKESGRKAAN
jgi:hypothetical protein